MGLFSFLEKDPTEKWADYKFIELVLDLRNGTLNSIQLGRDLVELKVFGKPDNKNPFKKKFFLYKNAGLIIGIDDYRITYFSFSLADNPYEELNACTFKLIDQQGHYHEISGKTRVPDFEKILGPSKEQYDIEEGEDREYYVGVFAITVEFDNDGNAICFDISID